MYTLCGSKGIINAICLKKKFLEELSLSPLPGGPIQAASICNVSFSITTSFRIHQYIHACSYKHLESSQGSFKKPESLFHI